MNAAPLLDPPIDAPLRGESRRDKRLAALARWSPALGMLVAAPALAIGLFVDDWFHLWLLELKPPGTHPLDLFRFTPADPFNLHWAIDLGLIPWWAPPSIKLAFWRPLSSLTTVFDHAVFGSQVWLSHVHSLVWYALAIDAARRLFRRRLTPAIANLATVIFALASSHWTAAAWLANRNALVATVPTFYGLLAHMKWREEHWKPGLPLSLAGYALGLAGGEVALAALGYLLAYELWIAPHYREGSPMGWSRWAGSVRALLPAATLGLVYLVAYKAQGYGAVDSGIYLDPTRTPVAFLKQAGPRALALAGAAVLTSPVDTWIVAPHDRVLLVLGGLLAVALVVAFLRSTATPRRREIGALLAGAGFSLAPVLATFPASRLLLVPSFGVSSVLAAMILASRSSTRRPLRIGGWVLAVLHLGVPWLFWPAATALATYSGRGVERMALGAEIPDATIAQQDAVVLGAADPSIAIYTPFIRQVRGHPLPAHWRALSFAPYDHRYTRVGPDSLEMEIVGGEELTTVFEQLIRSPELALRTGDEVQVEGMKVTIVEGGTVGPRRVRFDFDHDLDDPRYLFLAWEDGVLRRVPVPSLGSSWVWHRTLGPLPL